MFHTIVTKSDLLNNNLSNHPVFEDMESLEQYVREFSKNMEEPMIRLLVVDVEGDVNKEGCLQYIKNIKSIHKNCYLSYIETYRTHYFMSRTDGVGAFPVSL